jgi:mannitol/fructose-specific phosphotransferase system IIA component (Ntr-type)
MIPLKTLHLATPLEVFEQASTHLLKQGRRASLCHQCVYRFEEAGQTLKCGAGCFIADDEYLSSMECKGWKLLTSSGVVPMEHKHLIEEIQQLHDAVAAVDWSGELASLKKRVLRGDFGPPDGVPA